LKYAFPEGKGDIILEFKAKNDFFTLIVEDNGIGLPPDDIIRHSNTLGMQLIYSLCQQLEADIKIDRSGGTKFIITFEELKYKKRT
jgi:two-component sensor histidine kinase